MRPAAALTWPVRDRPQPWPGRYATGRSPDAAATQPA